MNNNRFNSFYTYKSLSRRVFVYSLYIDFCRGVIVKGIRFYPGKVDKTPPGSKWSDDTTELALDGYNKNKNERVKDLKERSQQDTSDLADSVRDKVMFLATKEEVEQTKNDCKHEVKSESAKYLEEVKEADAIAVKDIQDVLNNSNKSPEWIKEKLADKKKLN